jgi:hypothetical protein
VLERGDYVKGTTSLLLKKNLEKKGSILKNIYQTLKKERNKEHRPSTPCAIECKVHEGEEIFGKIPLGISDRSKKDQEERQDANRSRTAQQRPEKKETAKENER